MPHDKPQTHEQPDGSRVLYLDADWKPTTPEAAVYVEIYHPDGRVIIGVAN
jgi:hypothetical protein